MPAPSLHTARCPRRTARFGASLLAAVAGLGSVHAADPAALEEPPDHFLFVGFEVFVNEPEGPRPIVGFAKEHARVRGAGDDERLVPLLNLRRLRVQPALRVSPVEVTVADVNVIVLAGTSPQAIQEAMSRQLDLQNQGMHERALAEKNLVEANLLGSTDPVDQAQITQLREEAMSRLVETHRVWEDRHDLVATEADPGRIGLPGGAGLPDGVRLTYRISSSHVVTDACALVVLLLRTPTQPGSPSIVMRAFPLPTIGARPRTVDFDLTDLPPGFALESRRLHVFCGVGELATSLSAKRTSISRPDAHQFLVTQHLIDHADQDALPQPARELNPPGRREQFVASQLAAAVTIKVGADGVPVGYFADVDAREPLNPTLRGLISDILFLPALREGKPVESLYSGTVAGLL